MASSEIVMPQLGVNDDVALVAEWLVEAGQQVQRGAEIAVVETTKATLSLEAEHDGFIYPLVDAGTAVAVQRPIALLLDERDDGEAARLAAELAQGAATAPQARAEGAADAGHRLTERARAAVAELEVDPALLPTDRVIRENDVRALAGQRPPEQPSSAAARRVAVYGASQGGEALAEAITAMGGYEVVAFLDDTEGFAGQERFDLPVWSGAELERLHERGIGSVATHIAVRSFRLLVRDRAAAAGLLMLNAVHPRAWLAPSARLGVGNVIKAGAIVDTEVQLGDCCIVDNGAVVPHHNVIGDAAHLAPGVALGGDCTIGAEALVGVGAVVAPRVEIGRNSIVAPGAVVVRDVPDHVVVEGSPARVVGSRPRDD